MVIKLFINMCSITSRKLPRLLTLDQPTMTMILMSKRYPLQYHVIFLKLISEKYQKNVK